MQVNTFRHVLLEIVDLHQVWLDEMVNPDTPPLTWQVFNLPSHTAISVTAQGAAVECIIRDEQPGHALLQHFAFDFDRPQLQSWLASLIMRLVADYPELAEVEVVVPSDHAVLQEALDELGFRLHQLHLVIGEIAY